MPVRSASDKTGVRQSFADPLILISAFLLKFKAPMRGGRPVPLWYDSKGEDDRGHCRKAQGDAGTVYFVEIREDGAQ